MLKKGSTGFWVGAVQKMLHVKVDHEFGYHTETAVKKFQKAKGLKQDGIVGKVTFSKIFALDELEEIIGG